MEFFVCPCPEIGNVILDGKGQGPNKNGAGKRLTKMCNEGLHTVALQCPAGKTCSPQQVDVEITGTDPIFPMEVPFLCV